MYKTQFAHYNKSKTQEKDKKINTKQELMLPNINKNSKTTRVFQEIDNKNMNQSAFIVEFTRKLEQQEQEIVKRNEMIEIIQNDFQKLQILYNEEKTHNQDKINQIALMKQQNEDLNAINNRMNIKIKQIEGENNNQKQNMNKQANQMIQQLEIEILNLKKKIQGQNGELTKLVKKNGSLQLISEEKGRIMDQLESVKKRANEVEQEFKQVEAIKFKEEQEIDFIKKEIDKLEKDLQRSQDEIKLTVKQLDNHKNGEDQKNDQLNSLEKQNNDLKQQLNQKEAQIKQKQDQLKKHQDINKQTQTVEKKLQDLINQNKDLKAKDDEINKYLDKLKQDMNQAQQQMEQSQQDNDQRRQKEQKELEMVKNQLKQNLDEIEEIKKNNYEQKIKELVEKNDKLTKQVREIKQNQEQAEFINQIRKQDARIFNNLNCQYCKKTVVNPVTCIPCGHSFCISCEKGYFKNICYKCGPKTVVDAVYRNELLDELMQLFNNFRRGSKINQL